MVEMCDCGFLAVRCLNNSHQHKSAYWPSEFHYVHRVGVELCTAQRGKSRPRNNEKKPVTTYCN